VNTKYITPGQVCELIPGMTTGQLAQMRYKGNSGLKFYKPTAKTVLYSLEEVEAWIDNSARYGTSSVSNSSRQNPEA
jgi:hypothetical protein